MKAIIALLFPLFITASTCAQKNDLKKFNVIIGLHSGIYGTLYQHGYYYHAGVYQGDILSTENLAGFAVPVNAELLFNIHGFRTGLKVEYAGGLYFGQGSSQHLISGLACIEYGFRASKRVVIAPSFSGGISGMTYIEKGYVKDITHQRGYVLKGALNFEMGYKRVKFTVSPTYGFHQVSENADRYKPGKSRLHTWGLNLGVRFYLNKFEEETK